MVRSLEIRFYGRFKWILEILYKDFLEITRKTEFNKQERDSMEEEKKEIDELSEILSMIREDTRTVSQELTRPFYVITWFGYFSILIGIYFIAQIFTIEYSFINDVALGIGAVLMFFLGIFSIIWVRRMKKKYNRLFELAEEGE